ncbi:mediator of RNA polymerase II transcription subunit 1-like [Gastrophryne carolinensis]
MFYIEVQVKKNGHVGFVKLAHHGESPTICKELLQLLRAKDFDGFGKNLEGLLHMYNIPGNSEIKAKVYLALCSLEADLTSLYNLSRVMEITEGKVGYLSPRCGGKPMNIEYYISPYQVLEEKLKPGTCVVGTNVSVTVVGTNNWYSLQICTLFQELPQESGRFAELTEESRMALPACFFLVFVHPEPILLPLIQKIQNITGLPVVAANQAPLHELLINRKLKQDRVFEEIQFVVSLPGCLDHCYVLNSRTEHGSALMGALVNKIPFTHPSHVPSVLEVLRCQAAYNTLLNSCLSCTVNPKDHSKKLHFEVSLQKNLSICISFQHPIGGDLSCVVVGVLNTRKLTCSLYTSSLDLPLLCDNEFISKVLECCMSIPITMRTILKKAQKGEDSQQMETSCTNNNEEMPPQDSREIPSKMLSDPSHKPQESQLRIEKNVVIGSAYDPSEELYPEVNGIIHSVESHGPSSCAAQETNSSYTEDPYYNAIEVDSSGVEEPNSSLAEESNSTIAGETNSIIVQELSPIMAEVPSPNLAEDPSSSLTGELSSSIAEELSLSVSGLAMSRSVPEHEVDECY